MFGHSDGLGWYRGNGNYKYQIEAESIWYDWSMIGCVIVIALTHLMSTLKFIDFSRLLRESVAVILTL